MHISEIFRFIPQTALFDEHLSNATTAATDTAKTSDSLFLVAAFFGDGDHSFMLAARRQNFS